MGIRIPKPSSMTSEPIQRGNMNFLPCRKKSVGKQDVIVQASWCILLYQKAAERIANTASPIPVRANLGAYPVLLVS